MLADGIGKKCDESQRFYFFPLLFSELKISCLPDLFEKMQRDMRNPIA
jgi:hypothetical protein